MGRERRAVCAARCHCAVCVVRARGARGSCVSGAVSGGGIICVRAGYRGKSYFFSIPDNRPATAFHREHRRSDAPRGTMPTSCCDGSGTILSGLMCCTFH
jgi:hypothetical protein